MFWVSRTVRKFLVSKQQNKLGWDWFVTSVEWNQLVFILGVILRHSYVSQICTEKTWTQVDSAVPEGQEKGGWQMPLLALEWLCHPAASTGICVIFLCGVICVCLCVVFISLMQSLQTWQWLNFHISVAPPQNFLLACVNLGRTGRDCWIFPVLCAHNPPKKTPVCLNFSLFVFFCINLWIISCSHVLRLA